ncbi:glycosyltransferase family 2 protein [Parapusillimonas granuli]|uniref:Glycosyltransferase n=1 Tax=Parapusillimonas granuli TaxID=380911 RepID=A0A853FXG3_9BURK|nr:glycosyltransferase [Parapusillimonas granuli]MBB5214803.1 GT2 family glycosyltransferase [Parapusillimonas granuli]MEB2397949.1 glycosyltransferase [Alcaligenaceae bacterium]NYT48789.1 glycosyltransferase [Parapusillimonas granuli]
MSIYLNEKAEARVSIVVLTYNRRARVLGLLRRLQALAGDWPIIVVDNGSMDGTAAAVAAAFPSVLLIRAKRNLGAAARNIGAAYVHTPYIAFCDDYMQWEPDALERGVRLLDGAPDVAVLSSRIWKDGDPAGDEDGGAQHPAFQGFLAGACMVRTRAFCDVGGYWPPLFNGGEEVLMALDLVERGWRIVYAADVVARSLPSRREEADARNRLLLRNVIWVAWMRLPMRAAWRITAQQLRRAYRRRCLCRTALGAIAGLPRVLSHRQVVSAAAQQMKPTLGF